MPVRLLDPAINSTTLTAIIGKGGENLIRNSDRLRPFASTVRLERDEQVELCIKFVGKRMCRSGHSLPHVRYSRDRNDQLVRGP